MRSFALLGLGLVVLAWLQTSYGLWPLRRVREEIARMRAGQSNRIDTAMPDEVAPMVEELNALIEHNERQAEEARRHAGNLAHALKTPLTVIMNAATAQSEDLADTVIREARTMRRQVDHHLARARAVGRRGSAHSRADVWPSLESVERAVARLYRTSASTSPAQGSAGPCRTAGPRRNARQPRRERGEVRRRQRLRDGDGAGGLRRTDDRGRRRRHPEEDRIRIFDRGVRLDTGKPGTGLGLAIVRDVAEIYGGTVALEESEDLGGLLVRCAYPPPTKHGTAAPLDPSPRTRSGVHSAARGMIEPLASPSGPVDPGTSPG